MDDVYYNADDVHKNNDAHRCIAFNLSIGIASDGSMPSQPSSTFSHGGGALQNAMGGGRGFEKAQTWCRCFAESKKTRVCVKQQ